MKLEIEIPDGLIQSCVETLARREFVISHYGSNYDSPMVRIIAAEIKKQVMTLDYSGIVSAAIAVKTKVLTDELVTKELTKRIKKELKAADALKTK